MRVEIQVEPNTDEWLAARQAGLGASDMPSVLGICPWKQARTLFHEKRGELEPTRETGPMRFGKLLEPAAVQGFQEDTDIRVIQYPAPMFCRRDNPRHMATPDALLVDNQGLEAKCTSFFANTWDKPYDEVPDPYYVQAQWQMHVCGFARVWFSLLVSGAELFPVVVERDDDFIGEMAEAADRFWSRIENNEPPEWDADRGVDPATVKRRFTAINDSVIHLPREAAEHWANYERLKREIKELESEAASSKAYVMNAVGDSAAASLPGGGYVRRKEIAKRPFTVTPKPYIDFRRVEKL